MGLKKKRRLNRAEVNNGRYTLLTTHSSNKSPHAKGQSQGLREIRFQFLLSARACKIVQAVWPGPLWWCTWCGQCVMCGFRLLWAVKTRWNQVPCVLTIWMRSGGSHLNRKEQSGPTQRVCKRHLQVCAHTLEAQCPTSRSHNKSMHMWRQKKKNSHKLSTTNWQGLYKTTPSGAFISSVQTGIVRGYSVFSKNSSVGAGRLKDTTLCRVVTVCNT